MPATDPTTDPTTLPGGTQGAKQGRRPALPVALLAAVVPAYLFPALTTAVNALVIPDRLVADRLADAAWTTIAVPSAAAAALVTVWTHRRTPPVPTAIGSTARAAAGAALVCLLLAGAASAVLIGNGVLPASALQFTLSSAAIGGGLAGRRWARTNRPGRRIAAGRRRQARRQPTTRSADAPAPGACTQLA